MVIMEAKVKVDKAGRMVLPKEVRDELQLAPGDTLDLVSDGAPILAAETDRVLDAIRRGGRG